MRIELFFIDSISIFSKRIGLIKIELTLIFSLHIFLSENFHYIQNLYIQINILSYILSMINSHLANTHNVERC